MKFSYARRERARFVDSNIRSFMQEVLETEPLFFSDNSRLSDFHPFSGYESLDDMLRAGTYRDAGVRQAEEARYRDMEFIVYSQWVELVRQKTREKYGTAFEGKDPSCGR